MVSPTQSGERGARFTLTSPALRVPVAVRHMEAVYNHRLDYRGMTHRFNPDDVIALYDDIITRQRARLRVMIFPISA